MRAAVLLALVLCDSTDRGTRRLVEAWWREAGGKCNGESEAQDGLRDAHTSR